MPDHTCFQESRITRNEKDIQDIWEKREDDRKEIQKSIGKVHDRVDGIKNWFIVGMGSMTLYFIVAIVQFIFNWIVKQ